MVLYLLSRKQLFWGQNLAVSQECGFSPKFSAAQMWALFRLWYKQLYLTIFPVVPNFFLPVHAYRIVQNNVLIVVFERVNGVAKRPLHMLNNFGNPRLVNSKNKPLWKKRFFKPFRFIENFNLNYLEDSIKWACLEFFQVPFFLFLISFSNLKIHSQSSCAFENLKVLHFIIIIFLKFEM